jgi:RimJ/RimL family protein N-acetyltransferase
MSNWIENPGRLEGETIALLPLEAAHLPILTEIARDKRIWEFYPFDGTDSNRFLELYRLSITERDKGTQYPFVVFHKAENAIIGSTRYLDIQPQHRKLEIGATWLQPAYWGSPINLECKLLLLTHCFEMLKAVRVQLKTDENNIRSRKAIQKIGGEFEGILRKDMIRDNQTFRNSAYFSIIDEEWPVKKAALTNLYHSKKMRAV